MRSRAVVVSSRRFPTIRPGEWVGNRCGRYVLTAAALLFALVCPKGATGSGTFAGTVYNAAGVPVRGAMVSATHRRFRRSTTVFTDAAGQFRLPPLEEAVYDLRVRRVGYHDLKWQGVALPAAIVGLELSLEAHTDPMELAGQLPASRWLQLLLDRLSSDDHREEFIRQCTFCHQQGNWATRVPRSREDWDKIFKLMARMGGVISSDLKAELPDAFNAAFADKAYVAALTQPFVAPPPPQGAAAQAVVTEWDLGHPASMQHDLIVHPDGRIYSVDTNQDNLYRLDPRTSERTSWSIPRGDSPLGGVFGSSGLLLAPNSNAHLGPHSLQVASDGSIWVTLCLANKVARFDPAGEQWEIFKQRGGLYPHTLRIDPRGRIWYTLAVSNHVGMIDPKTGQRGTIRLPARNWAQAVALRIVPTFLRLMRYLPGDGLPAGEGVDLPIPYGIDIAPDGGVWFSQLNERRIGRIDPEYGTIKMIDTPFPGPRRLRSDSKGMLWIPGFSAGVIARYDPDREEFRTWRLPIQGIEAPYALNVDRRTDTVWICGTNSDTLIRFNPESEQFTVYPLPTRVTYTREIDFDANGGVWTSNSNFPSWQIEGSGPKIIRLQPKPEAESEKRNAENFEAR